MLGDRLWVAIITLWLIFVILTGGTSLPSPLVLTSHSVAAFVVILISVWRLRNGLPGRLPAMALLLAVLAFALVASHLVPLPPEIWSNLPGRDLIANTAKLAVGGALGRMPVSLNPAETKIALLDMLPAFASFIAMLTLSRKNLPIIGFTLLLCAFVCVFIGLIQRTAPADSFIHFQTYLGPGRASGTFVNVNFFAMQLYTALPFLAALAMTIQERFHIRGWLVVLFAVIYGAVILLGLAMIGSRAGIVMTMISVLLSILLVYRSRFGTQTARFSALPILVLGMLLIFGQVGMVGVLQLAGTDPLADYRSTIFEVSLQATQSFFPYGSGFGSFIPVYQMFETPSTILPNYVNHAHNDWIELVLEGGLPALVLLAIFVLLFLASVVAVFQLAYDNSANSYFRAAAVALLLVLLHAAIDFGLRTPAIAAIAATCFGIMVTARASHFQPVPRRKSNQNPSVNDHKPIRPFSKPTRGFQPRIVDDTRKISEGQS